MTSADTKRSTLLLDERTAIWVSLYEDDAVLHAAEVLARDFAKVLGRTPPVVHDLGDVAPDVPLIGIASRPDQISELGAELVDGGAESFRVTVSGTRLHLIGADNRGAIYAIYQFAETVLGIDPLWFWTDQKPARRDAIQVSGDLRLAQGTPTFRYRGWFMNDEDLLARWGRDREGQSAIGEEMWDVIYETILRCKGNMVIPGTFVFPDEPAVRLAGRRGLVISQHHCEILGSNFFRWPKDEPFSFVKNRRAVEAVWQNSVVTYGDQEMIWTVGYRGLTDRSFWCDDPGVAETDEERGRIIGEAIARQVEILKKFRHDPVIIWNAWDEGVALMEAGHLQLPEGVKIVWPDRRGGLMRDAGRVQAGQGAYVHPAFFNDTANHLSEAVPVDRFARELGRYAEASATEYLLLNVSCIRPQVLTIKAVMEMGWSIKPWQKDPLRAAEDYYERWNREQFGEAAADELDGFWTDLFEAPARFGPDECDVVADQVYHTITAAICRRILHDELAKEPLGWPLSLFPHESMAEKLAFISKATSEAMPAWDTLAEQARRARWLVPDGRREFFQQNVQSALEVGRQGNAMLYGAADGAGNLLAGDRAQAQEDFDDALEAAEATRVALKRAEYGKWREFYEYSWFTNYPRSIAILRAVRAHLRGEWPGDAVFVHHRTYTVSEALSYHQKGRYLETTPLNEFGEGIDNYDRWQL